MQKTAFHLINPVKNYAWGSLEHIAAYQNRPAPTVQPEAELWMGAHPSDSSQIVLHGHRVSLYREIQRDPDFWLGPAVAADFFGEFPYLLKILAAEKALSIQVHPSLIQARDGFAREEESGIPLSAAHRIYKDANHKPEMIVAQSDFWALSGFRPELQIQSCFTSLFTFAGKKLLKTGLLIDLHERVNELGTSETALQSFFSCLMKILLGDKQAGLQLLSAAQEAARTDLFPSDYYISEWILRLSRQFPDDPSAIAPLYLNVLNLKPGEAVSLEAGLLHAYLSGLGIEIMANSDNVIRAGLTIKHMDGNALVETVRCIGETPGILKAETIQPGAELFPQLFREFSLIRLQPDVKAQYIDRSWTPGGSGPRILLAGRNSRLSIYDENGNGHEISSGNSVIIPHAVESFSVRGTGEGFLSSIGI
ncbi:mannose-6-phosphate isomerase, class I [Spirochaeta dissipatitropha]